MRTMPLGLQNDQPGSPASAHAGQPAGSQHPALVLFPDLAQVHVSRQSGRTPSPPRPVLFSELRAKHYSVPWRLATPRNSENTTRGRGCSRGLAAVLEIVSLAAGICIRAGRVSAPGCCAEASQL